MRRSFDYLRKKFAPDYPPVTSQASADTWESLQALGFRDGQQVRSSSELVTSPNSSIYNEFGVKIWWGDLSKDNARSLVEHATSELFILNQSDSYSHFALSGQGVDAEYSPGYSYVYSHAKGIVIPKNLSLNTPHLHYSPGIYLIKEPYQIHRNPMISKPQIIHGFLETDENTIFDGTSFYARRLLAVLALNKQGRLNSVSTHIPRLLA